MTNQLKLLSILFFINIYLFPQSDKEVIATAGSSVITVEEFRDRFEFMPHLNYPDNHPDTLKKEFLYSLIAEKLWALEALASGFDTLDNVKYSTNALEKMLVKDELFRQEVESKIIITGEEISKSVYKVLNLLRVNIIVERDSIEAFRIFNSLMNDVDFDSLFLTREEYKKIPFEITLGKLQDENLEDIVYSLKPGELSIPFKTDDGWYIFKLQDVIVNPAIDPSTEQARNSAVKILHDRKQRKLAGNFLDKILAGKTYTADKELFNIYSDNLISLLKEKDNTSETDKYFRYQLNEIDLMRALYKIKPEDLSKTFINLDGKNLTLKDFGYYLVYQKIEIASSESLYVKKILNLAVRNFIEDEVLTNEGYKRRLSEPSYVKKDIKIWEDYYLSLLLMEEEAKNIKVTENDINQYLVERNSVPDTLFQINIIEILTDNVNKMEIILDELNQGTDFRELAKKFNQRETTKNSDGIWGFFPVNKGGEIGRIASEMEPGEIYGPLKLPEGYSIFQLIDKISTEIIPSDSVGENREFLKLQISLRKMDEIINIKTVEFAEKHGIKINRKLLDKISLSELNTFTYRFIGFGGKIAAFPIITPVYDWYKLYQQKKELP